MGRVCCCTVVVLLLLVLSVTHTCTDRVNTILIDASPCRTSVYSGTIAPTGRRSFVARTCCRTDRMTPFGQDPFGGGRDFFYA